MAGEQNYSTWGRPFRLQLSTEAAGGFEAPASRGRCQYPECHPFEWDWKRAYCREHWLQVHGRDCLPDRPGLP